MTKKTAVRKLKRGDGGGVGSLMLAFVAFVFGYLIATIFDINQMQTWVNSKLQTDSKAKLHAKAERHHPKPKLEFYTLLANNGRVERQKVEVDKPSIKPGLNLELTKATEKPVPNLEPPKDLKSSTKVLPVPGNLATKTINDVNVANLSKYVLQVGSFKNKAEAERMRAKLVIKGFDVMIASVNQQNVNWFRVMVGPVISLKEAESLKSNLASRERINGMIRKVDA